jgi:colanic acid biosynthesis glycosyl transferase WcaI
VKILILTLVFPPDNVSTAHIVGRLAAEFAHAGHQVVVLTSTPHYHPDADGRWRQKLRPVVGPLVQRSDTDGVTAYHVWMPSKNQQPAARLVAWLWFHAATTVLGMVVGTGSDVIVAPSPPLTIGVEARLLGLRHRAPFVYNVQELYPDVAIALGAIRNGSIIRLLKWLERWVYAQARFVTVIGARMRSNLLAKGVPPEEVITIPNFVDADELPIRPRNNAFAAAHGLDGRFVVSYAGNLGVPQGLNTVIQAAQLLREAENIEFVLIGDGAAAGDLRRQAESLGLRNVRFLPFQPFDVVPDIYAASDVCLVPQAAGTGLHGLPSKIYRIMACGRPMIGMCDPDSEVADLIRDAQCGLVVRPNDPEALAVAVTTASESGPAWNLRGAQGRSFVQRWYSVGEVTTAYLSLFEGARSSRRQ